MKYPDIKNFLLNYPFSHVNLCYTTIGGLGLAENLMISAERVNFPIVLFALDDETYHQASGSYDTVRVHSGPRSLNHHYRYNSPGFKEISWARWSICNEILKSGRSLIYLDTDIVVKKNFQEELLSLHHQFPQIELFAQSPPTNYCLGFYSIPSRAQKSIEYHFCHPFPAQNDYSSYDHDQHFLNTVIAQKGNLQSKGLDRDLYPNGRHYYNDSSRIDPTCNLIHFNCVIGKERKIEKMRKYGYWSLPRE
tara:strand:- start:1412 stop:2161 length:750 start_codon:yes stop_codon:yes gene_type:complete